MKRLAFIAAAMVLMGSPGHAEVGGWFGGNVEVPDRQGDAVVAGGAVTIAGRVGGDAMIAAGQARLNGDVLGDMRVMSGDFRQSGDVSGELAIASGKIDIDGGIGDDLYAAAEDVRLGPDTRVGGNARIAGQDVLIKGRIDGDLDVQGEDVALSAQIGGNVTIAARSIVLGPDTTIEGKLIWKAATAPDIPGEAIIVEGVDGQIVKSWDQRGGWAWDRPWSAAPRSAIFAGEAAARLMVGVSAFLIGLALVLLAPGSVDRGVEIVRRRWPAALMWGAAIVAFAPALALVLMATIIAIPLGALVLLGYPLVLLAGYGAGGSLLGALALAGKTRSRRALAVAAGVGGLTLLAFLPFLGALISLGATMLGVGVWIVLARAPAGAQAASASAVSAMRDTAT